MNACVRGGSEGQHTTCICGSAMITWSIEWFAKRMYFLFWSMELLEMQLIIASKQEGFPEMSTHQLKK